MTEFVLILPVLAILVGLTFFLSWAHTRKHEVLVADRYSAWRKVEAGSWPTHEDLNRIVFKDRATSLNLSGAGAVTETVDELVAGAGQYGPNPEELARELVINRFPTGRRALVVAEFDPNQALWERFAGPIHHHHGREGLTWRRDEVNCWQTLRDLYYSLLDESLRRVPPPGEKMAQMIRQLYLRRW